MLREPLNDFLRAQALSAPLSHSWDSDDPLAQLPENNPDSEQQLGRVSDFAKLAYSLVCADWVLYRLRAFTDSEWPWYFRDACWAYALDQGYGLPEEIEDHPQEGPVDGPMCLALTTVLNTRYGFDEGNAEIDAANAELIVLHVLSDPGPFIQWRHVVLQRLIKFHPVKSQERTAIDMLDPTRNPGRPGDPLGLKASLSRLQLNDNPYLVPIIEAGKQ
jgi:hypothetical protein